MKQKSVVFLFLTSFLFLQAGPVFADGKFLEPCVGGSACDAGLVCQDGKICVYEGGKGPSGITDLYLIVNNIVNWVFVFIILLSIIFVIMGAFQFVTANGEPAKIDSARQRLIWSAIGIGVAILARAFPNIIRGLIG